MAARTRKLFFDSAFSHDANDGPGSCTCRLPDNEQLEGVKGLSIADISVKNAGHALSLRHGNNTFYYSVRVRWHANPNHANPESTLREYVYGLTIEDGSYTPSSLATTVASAIQTHYLSLPANNTFSIVDYQGNTQHLNRSANFTCSGSIDSAGRAVFTFPADQNGGPRTGMFLERVNILGQTTTTVHSGGNVPISYTNILQGNTVNLALGFDTDSAPAKALDGTTSYDSNTNTFSFTNYTPSPHRSTHAVRAKGTFGVLYVACDAVVGSASVTRQPVSRNDILGRLVLDSVNADQTATFTPQIGIGRFSPLLGDTLDNFRLSLIDAYGVTAHLSEFSGELLVRYIDE